MNEFSTWAKDAAKVLLAVALEGEKVKSDVRDIELETLEHILEKTRVSAFLLAFLAQDGPDGGDA